MNLMIKFTYMTISNWKILWLYKMLFRIFKHILDENVDEGVPPEQALQLISTYCANDIETFLYDFISEQIDEDNETYAYGIAR